MTFDVWKQSLKEAVIRIPEYKSSVNPISFFPVISSCKGPHILHPDILLQARLTIPAKIGYKQLYLNRKLDEEVSYED